MQWVIAFFVVLLVNVNSKPITVIQGRSRVSLYYIEIIKLYSCWCIWYFYRNSVSVPYVFLLGRSWPGSTTRSVFPSSKRCTGSNFGRFLRYRQKPEQSIKIIIRNSCQSFLCRLFKIHDHYVTIYLFIPVFDLKTRWNWKHTNFKSVLN